MKITTTEEKVVIDGSNSLLLTTNKAAIDLSGIEIDNSIPIDIQYFTVVQGKRMGIQYAAKWLGYNKWQQKVFKAVAWLFTKEDNLELKYGEDTKT